jgi:curved DNA-binding protein CbpA
MNTKDMKDYYKILEISYGATTEEIKKAFRKKAHIFHPDKAGGNAEKFKEINEAYTYLIAHPTYRPADEHVTYANDDIMTEFWKNWRDKPKDMYTPQGPAQQEQWVQ